MDPAALALPTKDTKGKDGVGDTSGGSGSVSAIGAADYATAIVVPPGRSGMAPSLSLSYSSSGHTRGGVAVGWQLAAAATIEVDATRTSATQRHYRSNLLGGGGRLIRNTVEPAATGIERYRAELDKTFAHYSFDPTASTWIVRTLDGKTYTYAAQIQSTRWHLTKVEDALGNQIVYQYEEQNASGYRELILTGIEYTANPTQSVAAHARVQLVYAPLLSCGNGLPMGAELDRHFGVPRMTGSRRLTAIETQVKDTATGSSWRPVRRYDLRYDETELACAASGLRYLERIDQTAYSFEGTATAAAPLTFTYGAKQRALDTAWAIATTRNEGGDVWGPTRMLRDFDGDGWLDELTMETRERCTLAVRPGRGVLQFAPDADVRRYPLRSAEWYNGVAATGVEKCTLAGQIAEREVTYEGGCKHRRVMVNYHFVDWDGDGQLDVLSNLYENYEGLASRDFSRPVSYAATTTGGTTCGDNSHPIEGGCQCNDNYHPMAGGGCGLCPNDTVYDPSTQRCASQCEFSGGGGCDFRNPVTPPTNPGGGSGPVGCTSPDLFPQRTQPNNAASDFLFRLQKNENGALASVNGAFAVTSPVALPVNPMQLSSIAINWTKPDVPAYLDINGDGYLDMLSLYPDPRQPSGPVTYLGTATQVYVWLGTGGGFALANRQRWLLPSFAPSDTTSSWDAARGFFETVDAARFLDFNGDGLPDLVVRLASSGQLAIAYNEGVTDTEGGRFSAMAPINAFVPADITRTESAAGPTAPPYLSTGYRGVLSTLADIDGDGLPELFAESTTASLAGSATQRRAWRFAGGLLFGYRDLGAEWEALEEGTRFTQNVWQRESDYLDVSGDGVPDAVQWSNGSAQIRTGHNVALPARLLVEARNGQGGVTRFAYAASTDANVVAMEGGRLPAHYVVRSITRDSGVGAPVTTTYEYAGPRHGWDSALDTGPEHLLGFARITTHQSGQQGWDSSKQIASYSYTRVGDDWRAHLKAEATIAKRQNGSDELVSMSTIDWDAKSGIAAFVWPKQKTVQRCDGTTGGAAVGGMPVCTPLATVVTTQDWVAIGPQYGADGPMAYVEDTTTEESSDLPAPAKSYVHYDYEVRQNNWLSPAAGYRVFQTRVEKGAVTNGQRVPMAKSETEYDLRGLPFASHQYTDATHRSTTTSTFNALGLVASVQTPEQTAAGSALKTTFEYDDRGLFVWRTANPLKQVTEVGVDLGTGAQRWVRGPDTHRVCGTNGCADIAEYREQRLDGFGRVLETRALVEAPYTPDGTILRSVSFTNYLDAPTAIVTQTDVQDALAGTLIRTVTQLDGFGRAVSIKKLHWNDAQQSAESRFTYDARGDLASEQHPDPRVQTTAALVTTTYTRDGLGRLVSSLRPDGSGEDLLYNELTVQQDERSTLQARTTTTYSALGRIRYVAETQSNGIATTSHLYDALGRLTQLTDPDGAKTDFEYDWASRRTAIVRGNRRWTIQYNRDGNVLAVTKPVPQGANAAAYTSTKQYDLAGRLLVDAPATLGLSATERQQLGIGDRSYRYEGMRQTQVVLPIGDLESSFDLRGRLVRQDQRLQIPLTSVVSNQHYTLKYDDASEPVSIQWDDGTQWRTEFDQMGRVQLVDWIDPAIGAPRVVASYARNPAGKTYLRSAQNGIDRQWQYDVLGRVQYDRIWQPASGKTLAERNYAYDSNEVSMVWGKILKVPADATYQYDRAHRLTTAVGPGPYRGDFTFSPAGNVSTAHVVGAFDVSDRNVSYVYSPTESQAVERLHSIDGGTDPVVLTYDLDGNVVQRVTLAGTFAYLWDGENQLRQAQGPNGTERYFFGLNGQRLASVGNDVKVWFGGSETHYTQSGAQLVRWQHIGVGDPLARVENGQTLELQFVDALQNLLFTVDAAGSPTASFFYGAFGEVVASTGGSSHPRQFNGKENDLGAGLRHYGYRSYDPVLLRWTSSDPLYRFAPEFAGAQANLYSFSQNNPMRYYDADGRNAHGEGSTESAIETNVTCKRLSDCLDVSLLIRRGGNPRGTKLPTQNGRPSSVGSANTAATHERETFRERYLRLTWPKVKAQLQNTGFMTDLQEKTQTEKGPLFNAPWGPMPGTPLNIGGWIRYGNAIGDPDANNIWYSISSQYISELTYDIAIYHAAGFDVTPLQSYFVDPDVMYDAMKSFRADLVKVPGVEPADIEHWDYLTNVMGSYRPL